MDGRWLVLGLLVGCGANVTVYAGGNAGGGGEGGGGVGLGGDCFVDCIDACDDMYAGSCADGEISCGLAVPPEHCGCQREPYACEICPGGTSGYECQPTLDCVGACEDVVLCGECPAEGSSADVIGACRCDCPDESFFRCTLEPGCCNAKEDCGPDLDVQCVEHVCLPSVDDACWSDADCPPDLSCIGASICPCGALCEEPSTPGSCVGEK
jgi:hypothetical protein